VNVIAHRDSEKETKTTRGLDGGEVHNEAGKSGEASGESKLYPDSEAQRVLADEAGSEPEQFALDDERRVKILSPTALVLRRFIRNKLAVIGMVILIMMFLFSFLGGALMPYAETQVFMQYEPVVKTYASATKNASHTMYTLDGTQDQLFRGQVVAAINGKRDSFEFNEELFSLTPIGDNGSYIVARSRSLARIEVLKVITTFFMEDGVEELSDEIKTAAKDAIDAGEMAFSVGDVSYSMTKSGRSYYLYDSAPYAVMTRMVFVHTDESVEGGVTFDDVVGFETALAAGETEFGDGRSIVSENEDYYVWQNGAPLLFVSNLYINPAVPGAPISDELREQISLAINTGDSEFLIGDVEYRISGTNGSYTISTEQNTQTIMVYSAPSSEHWLGTDANGMDILTRLMYGGRVSLTVGFVAILLENLIGIILGGIAGYFGGFWDMFIMRMVDVFNCIPMIPLYLILGTAMDGAKVDGQLRIYALMLIFGIFGWTGTARLVRGQILSLREQEFMIAAEACGIRPSRRIFRHLVPNVTPQLIVMATMGLGGIILSESTLSFLGLGVKFPFASWGSQITAVNQIHVLTNYLFAWIPPGFCILAAVLGFNFVGDGLRDAFDPRMKR
jgi:peptide/nickel transport system permease protein